MKKILLAATTALLSISAATAQKSTFEGTIKYAISFDVPGMSAQELKAVGDYESTTYIKGDNRRTDFMQGKDNTSSLVENLPAKEFVKLYDVKKHKFMQHEKLEDIDKEQLQVTDIKYLAETKTIAGYACKRADVTIRQKDGKDQTVTVYYTEEIPLSTMQNTFKGLKGFPMQYSMSVSIAKIVYTVASVSKASVPDSKFVIPASGYKEVTDEELQKELSKIPNGYYADGFGLH